MYYDVINQPGQGLEQVAGQNERSETQVWWTFIKVDLPSIAEWFHFGDVENVQTYSETHMLHGAGIFPIIYPIIYPNLCR